MKRTFSLPPQVLVVLVSAYIVTVSNVAFWSRLLTAAEQASMPRGQVALVAGLCLFALSVAALSVFAVPYVFKPVAILIVMTSASIEYFLTEYGAVVDTNMVRNVLQTNAAEAGDLIGLGFVYSVALWGGIPAALISATAIAWKTMSETIATNARMSLFSVGLTSAIAVALLPAIRDVAVARGDLLYALVPYNVITATTKFLRSKEPWLPKVVRPYGEDAHLSPTSQTPSRPLVTVLVIGETARAANFSLMGYSRLTNPQLASVDGLLSFPHVTSCGTDTAHSVPCIFSGLGREHFTPWKAASQENLLDIVERVGLTARWRENQGGCKGVCRRIPTEDLAHSRDLRFCAKGECYDEILLDGLDEQIASMKRGGVIVLHMMGSHGPYYYLRVPSEFRAFKPTCDTRQIRTCSVEALINTYDNTILYTDHVLTTLIALLKKAADRSIDTSMIYVSDHGESLGESGTYLHGTPYFMAPSEQTHVPMLMWIAPSTRLRLGIDHHCLQQMAREARLSHDNVFHSVLGTLDIKTRAYDRALDIIEPCRRRPHNPI